MTRRRYTIVDLREDIATINRWMANEGIRKRLEIAPRYGYQAVDAYSVDADGVRIGSGVDRNVEVGSSRECSVAAHAYYGAQHRRG